MTAADATCLDRIRVRGGVGIDFRNDGAGTYAARLAEADGYRVRLPAGGDGAEAVLLNTGGGIAGGDRVALEVGVGAHAAATVTSVSAERVYRSAGAPARIDVALTIGENGRLDWLPQETILSSGARLERRLDVTMAASATLVIADIVILGRHGAGEAMRAGAVTDRWQVRRDDRVVHVEALRLSGDVASAMARPAIGGGAHVVATLLCVGPDIGRRIDAVRAVLATSVAVEAAASTWDDKLVVRALAARGDHMRAAIAAALCAVRPGPLPRTWTT
jgi:urease accessory protein